MEALTDLNDHMERQEKERKDVRKKRREKNLLSELMTLKCVEAGCDFVGQTRAGLVNHVWQRYERMARVMKKCPF